MLLTSDYTGVLVKTAEGRPVAQWLAHSGVAMIAGNERRRPPDASIPTPEPDAGVAQVASETP